MGNIQFRCITCNRRISWLEASRNSGKCDCCGMTIRYIEDRGRAWVKYEKERLALQNVVENAK